MYKFKLTPPEAKRAWVDALKSGNYKQTECCLNDKHGHCCLGVACDVFQKIEGRGHWVELLGEETSHGFEVGEKMEEFVLPDEVAHWLMGNGEYNPFLLREYFKGNVSCVGCNDDHDLSFEEIAILVENSFNVADSISVFSLAKGLGY